MIIDRNTKRGAPALDAHLLLSTRLLFSAACRTSSVTVGDLSAQSRCNRIRAPFEAVWPQLWSLVALTGILNAAFYILYRTVDYWYETA